jgi:hypothetical protein
LLAGLPSGKMIRLLDRFSALFRMPCRATPMQKCVPKFTKTRAVDTNGLVPKNRAEHRHEDPRR